MVEAESSSGKKTMIWFNQRRFPAVTLAKQVIDSDALGRIFHYRAAYLQDWGLLAPVPPLGGKYLLAVGCSSGRQRGNRGSGRPFTGYSHVGSTVRSRSFPQSPKPSSRSAQRQDKPDTTVKVEIDDASQCMTRFANGSIGSFEATRYACGRKNAQKFEINGELGSLAFNAETPHELQFYNYKDESSTRGWRTISVWDSEQPLYGALVDSRGLVPPMNTPLFMAAADLLADLDDGKQEGARFFRRA